MKPDEATLRDFKTWLNTRHPDAHTFISLLNYWINKFAAETLDSSVPSGKKDD